MLKDEKVEKIINLVIAEVEKELNDSKISSITKTVSLSVFRNKLPESINLCRVFILRADAKSKVERHTNSFQRTLTWKGNGETKVLENDKWTLYRTKSAGINLEDRWISVPANIWHQPISGNKNWITVTFHTASENEIIDEYTN